MKELISTGKKQYKANLHCHSTNSDGKLTPEELKKTYKEHGYSVLAITDHERAKDYTYMSEPDFMMLTGYEIYIRPNNVYDRFGKEIHMNLLARDPHNVGMVNYNEAISIYMPEEEKKNVTQLGKNEQRMYNAGYINRTIQKAKDNGYIVTYNHPYWSHEDIADVMSYRGFFSMEMCNYSSYCYNMLEYNGQMYDELLRNEVRIACHSTDDNHNYYPEGHPLCDSFGGFTYILADQLEYSTIFEALEKGEFYSSMGPQIYEVTMDGRKIHVKCSPAARILMFYGGKNPEIAVNPDGSCITEAEFELNPRAQHFRISVMDPEHRFADTRGFFPEDWD